jgi:hypothetical protein
MASSFKEAKMSALLRIALVAVTTSALLISQTGCSEDISCPEDWHACPPVVVDMEFVNLCVDSATALQVRIEATHEYFDFPWGSIWIEVPRWNNATVIDSLGGGEYCLTNTMYPDAEPIALGEEARFAMHFEGGYHVVVKDAVFLKDTVATTCYDAAPCPRGSGVGVLVDYDMSAGLELEVFNANDFSGADPVALFELQWAAATDTLPISNLVWGDSLLESLAWTSPATNLPVTLLPGQPPLVYDIPDNDVLDADVVLVRAHSSSSTLETKGIVQGDLRSSGTGVTGGSIPGFRLMGSYPHPFSESTTIEYELERPSDVVLTIYDVRGKRVARIKKPSSLAGRQTITWSGKDEAGRKVRSGVYFCRLEAGRYSDTRKIVVVR